jgi:hypothetical protein
MMYFWDDDGQRILWNSSELSGRGITKNGYSGLLCVNTFKKDPYNRYGSFDGSAFGGWEHIPLEMFPLDCLIHFFQHGAIIPTLHYYAGQQVVGNDVDYTLEGSYIYLNKTWYHIVHGMNKIPIEDVPQDIRLHAALVLGEFT